LSGIEHLESVCVNNHVDIKNKMKHFRLVAILLCLACFFSCRQSDKPDISRIQAPAEIIRFDQMLASCQDTTCIRNLMKTYPAFSEIYFRHILQLTHPENTDSVLAVMAEWKSDTTLTMITQKVAEEFDDLTKQQKQLDELFAYLKYYFPDTLPLPAIYTCLSGMAMQSFIFQETNKRRDGIGIGLDMLLHPAIPYKRLNPDNTAFSDYLTRSWNKDHLTRKVAETILSDQMGTPQGSRLIDQMVYEGKKIYLLKLVMPETPDSIITEYSQSQLDWCEKNELQMWSFFFDEKLFFETSPVKIAKYVYPAPSSAGMPEEAPGRTAAFLGWKIVIAYMERFPKTSITELLAIHDGQLLLEKSKYKPSR
jgi:hypothetical protein